MPCCFFMSSDGFDALTRAEPGPQINRDGRAAAAIGSSVADYQRVADVSPLARTPDVCAFGCRAMGCDGMTHYFSCPARLAIIRTAPCAPLDALDGLRRGRFLLRLAWYILPHR